MTKREHEGSQHGEPSVRLCLTTKHTKTIMQVGRLQ